MSNASSIAHRSLSIVVCMLALAVCSIGEAAKPASGGGGGGGGTTATGTVYFEYTGGLWSMTASGANKAQLDLDGLPSPKRYGGHRWFIQRRPDYEAQVMETWLQRDDGVEHQLFADPDLEVSLEWGPEGLLLSAGRRWQLDGTVDPDSCGIYVAEIAFDANGELAEYVPPVPLAPLPTTLDEEGQPVVDIGWGWYCAPDLTQIVQTRLTEPGLWITDLVTGQMRLLTTDGGFSPKWSPDGSRIAYSLADSIVAINPDGSGRSVLVRAKYPTRLSEPDWSPDGSHLLYKLIDLGSYPSKPDEIYRMTATGGSKINLTSDIGGWFGQVFWCE